LTEGSLSAETGAWLTYPLENGVNYFSRLRPFTYGSWQWRGGRFYARDGALALTSDNDGDVDIYLAAATPLALAPFEDLVTDDWDWVAF
jgi:hypothetical protein